LVDIWYWWHFLKQFYSADFYLHSVQIIYGMKFRFSYDFILFYSNFKISNLILRVFPYFKINDGTIFCINEIFKTLFISNAFPDIFIKLGKNSFMWKFCKNYTYSQFIFPLTLKHERTTQKIFNILYRIVSAISLLSLTQEREEYEVRGRGRCCALCLCSTIHLPLRERIRDMPFQFWLWFEAKIRKVKLKFEHLNSKGI
jgi:hypothetical protein